MKSPYESATSFIKQSMGHADPIDHAIYICKTFIDFPVEYVWLNDGVDNAKLVLEELKKIK